MNALGRRLVVLLLVGLAPWALPGSPASAAGTGNPAIQTPVGTTGVYAWEGPLQVDFGAAPVDTYTVSLSCPDAGVLLQYDETTDETTNTVDFPTGPVVGPTQCSVDVVGSTSGATASRTFTVTPYARPYDVSEDDPYFYEISRDRATIYSVVRGGGNDTVALSWWTDDYEPATLAFSVYNSANQLVRRRSTSDTYDTSVAWSGLNNSGNPVPAGVYQIVVTVIDADNATHHFRRSVTVATKIVTVRAVKRVNRAGGGSVTFARRGSCYVNPAEGGAFTLDCWGGRYAQATLVGRVPEGARITDMWLSSTSSGLCCSTGTITRRVWKYDARTVKAIVRVTSWRAHLVRYLAIEYTYRKRI